MDFFPLFANLRNQPCLVVGGGVVAARKARELIAAGASLTVNATRFEPSLQELSATARVRLHPGEFDPRLIEEHLLVIAATSDPAVNRLVAEQARAARRLCNVVDDGEASSFIVPGIIDRSPLVVAVSSGGRAPVLSRLLRQRLEQWLPARLGALAEWAGRWRERVRGTLPEPGSRRAFWEQLLAGPAAASVLAGDERTANARAERLLDGDLTPVPPGRAWLVGAGPGDPGLISVRGLQVLQEADVVLHDRLVAPELLRAARREAQVICVGKAGGRASTRQDDINRILVEHVRAGRKVCRLKGGDPFIFGRGGEEALALAAAGLPCEIVPGITAASGCGAHAGIPLTHRGLSDAVTLVTARTAGASDPDWALLGRASHTLAIYMGSGQIGAIAAELVRHGRARETPAALIAHGTAPSQVVITGTLADIGTRCLPAPLSPALLVVGATAALAGRLEWRLHADAAMALTSAPAALFA